MGLEACPEHSRCLRAGGLGWAWEERSAMNVGACGSCLQSSAVLACVLTGPGSGRIAPERPGTLSGRSGALRRGRGARH
eukprot:7784016-Pyramimonas_sp.AAC.1